MIEFEFRLICPQPARETWARLTALDRHTRSVPFTKVEPAGESMVAGLRFVAETKVGPFRLRDQMRVDEALPPGKLPGTLVIAKLRPFPGRIIAKVAPGAPGSSLIWRQQVSSRLARPLSDLAARLVRLAYRRSVNRIVSN